MENYSGNTSAGRQIAFISFAVIIYWILFVIFYAYVQIAPVTIILIPLLTFCWYWGSLRGLLAGAIIALASIYFRNVFHLHHGDPIREVLSIFISFSIGGAAGWVRKLYDAEKRHFRMLAEKHEALVRESEERRKAEKRVMWDEYFLKTMSNSSPLGILAIGNAADEVLYCNHKFCEIWNLKEYEEEIESRKIKGTELIDLCLQRMQDPGFYRKNLNPALDIHRLDTTTVDILLKDERTLRRFTSPILGHNDEYLGRLLMYEDITESKKAEDLLKKRSEYEHLIYTISNQFINVSSENIEEAFNSSLKIVGEFLEMDRGYFFRYEVNSGSASNLCEWRSPKFYKTLSRIFSVEPDNWPSFKEKLNELEKVVIPDVEKMPATMETEKKLLLERGIRAIIVLPVIFRNSLVGFLGFDSMTQKKFTEDTSAMLKIISNTFANALNRRYKNDALSKSEERFRLMVQHSADVVAVIDREGAIRYNSQVIERILGYKPDERLGKSLFQLVHPDEVPKIKGIINSLQNKKTPVLGPHYIRVRHKDGSYLYLESIFTDQLDNPAINGIIINARDFTQHLNLQEALRNSRNFLNAVINNAGDPMFVKDSCYKWILVNDAFCKLTGYKREEMLGKTAYELFPGDEADVFSSRNSKVLETGDTENFEIRFTDKQNNVHDVVSHLSIYQEDGGEKYIIANLRDETRRKELEKEIHNALLKEKELNDLKSKFISMVSHEYRTPLTAILSSTELLELFGVDMTLDEKQEHLNKIKNSVEYLISLLNDVLLINRAESGRVEFSPLSFEVLGFCRDLLKNLVDGAKCKVELEADFTSKTVFMDKKLLSYILMNLLSNAIKYSNEGGTVRFRVISCDGKINFEIIDHGMGIPVEDQARLFEPFFRANNAAHISGSGLGLSIVKNCVDLHRGSISFESSPDEGTKFLVSLPCAG